MTCLSVECKLQSLKYGCIGKHKYSCLFSKVNLTDNFLEVTESYFIFLNYDVYIH